MPLNELPAFSPSGFMRRRRPERFSDSESAITHVVDRAQLEYALDSITARNETHELEIFCRKLCERTICPNLRPATGPEGGGDSKADSETVPVAESMAMLSYVGEPRQSEERWAFAFSAKKTWSDKVRGDVAGLIATKRPYQRIYCVTSRFARDRDRARIEDELSVRYDVKVTILDRSWIINEVIDKDRKDLAVNYLNVGEELLDPLQLGPSDYSRTRELAELEKRLADPESFAGMKSQRAVEALVAARLSRGLERPRHETDGRLMRAMRLADHDGWAWHRVNALYEYVRTAYWWFDDVTPLLAELDRFAALQPVGTSIQHLRLTSTLLQLLINAVIHGGVSAEDAQLERRMNGHRDALADVATNKAMPNMALEARLGVHLIDLYRAMFADDRAGFSVLWTALAKVVRDADGLAEFDADGLVQLIEVFGDVAGADPGYDDLIDEVARFVEHRRGTAESALVLLRRARGLGDTRPLDVIRLLGGVVPALHKKEYVGSQIEAGVLLMASYAEAGLPWAARASVAGAVASIFVQADEDGLLPADAIPVLTGLAGVLAELAHVPDLLHILRLLRGSARMMPPDGKPASLLEQWFLQIDLVLGARLNGVPRSTLEALESVPDVLAGLGMEYSRAMLLHALGYGDLLVEEGWVDTGPEPQTLDDFFDHVVRQVPEFESHLPVLFNGPSGEVRQTLVLGVLVSVMHGGSDAEVLLAEAVVASIEAFFGTVLDLSVFPFEERFDVVIELSGEDEAPSVMVDAEATRAVLRWPAGKSCATNTDLSERTRLLLDLAAGVLSATCMAQDGEAIGRTLIQEDKIFDRLSLVASSSISYSRALSNDLSRLDDWSEDIERTWPWRPTTTREPTKVVREADAEEPRVNPLDHEAETVADAVWAPPVVSNHRQIIVRSTIKVPTWNKARWRGIGFGALSKHEPPLLGLLFENEQAAAQIFSEWRARFGPADEGEELHIGIVTHLTGRPSSYYHALITSRPDVARLDSQKIFSTTARHMEVAPNNSQNLNRFLTHYRHVKVYRLVPMILEPDNCPPRVLLELGLFKSALNVVRADDVGANDLESIVFSSSRSAGATQRTETS